MDLANPKADDDMTGLSLVIPVYNEADNISALLSEIEEHVGAGAEILICYDFEEDSTLPAVRETMSRFPNLRLVRNRYGRGPIGAVRSGFETAKGPAVAVVMADLSDDLACMWDMLRLFSQGCHVVSASRYMKGGRQTGGPLLKRTLSRLAGLSLWYLGLGTRDATNSFKLYSKEFLDSVDIESDGGFEVSLELTVKAFRRGLRVAEVPATWRDRTGGESRFRLWRWLPKYLRWYCYALTSALSRRARRRIPDATAHSGGNEDRFESG